MKTDVISLKAARRYSRDELCDRLTWRGTPMRELLEIAGDVRDAGHGRTISFSRKVFLPLTNLCRDYCAYCTFRKDPGDSGAATMSPDEVRRQIHRAEQLDCREALLSLGDKPEALFPQMRRQLHEYGHVTTVDYLVSICRMILDESELLPHSNPGLMSERTLQQLKQTNPSVGLMLESTSDRLTGPGMCHEQAPDKSPRLRLQTIATAGRLQIPFTTGILIGIGETMAERVDALLAIGDLHQQYGHIQEVIIQNFRSKPDIPMADHPEPTIEDHMCTIAVARLIFGPDMNIQVPPNLAGNDFPQLLGAGINDWGGISPLTPDFINPEAPWPQIDKLRQATQSQGFTLRERLAVYPRFVDRAAKGSAQLADRLAALTDADGFRRGGL